MASGIDALPRTLFDHIEGHIDQENGFLESEYSFTNTDDLRDSLNEEPTLESQLKITKWFQSGHKRRSKAIQTDSTKQKEVLQMVVAKSHAHQLTAHLLDQQAPRGKRRCLSPVERIHLQKILNICHREARVPVQQKGMKRVFVVYLILKPVMIVSKTQFCQHLRIYHPPSTTW